jgi:hypothetical protein
MHLLTFIKLYRPSLLERLLVLAVQVLRFDRGGGGGPRAKNNLRGGCMMRV